MKASISIVIPTYRRESVLLDTIEYLLASDPPPGEIVVVDQTEQHEQATSDRLKAWHESGTIRWLRQSSPSITRAMNTGLEQSVCEVVLFLDDDIVPGPRLLAAHLKAQATGVCNIVAGQVLQPGEVSARAADADADFRFYSSEPGWINEVMGGNFSVKRARALELGGFDENFVHVAYRFEAEFCDRAIAAGEKIFFEPDASIRHLKAQAGGTRAYGSHLTTTAPSHSVGAYYYLLRTRKGGHRFEGILGRLLHSIKTRHHLSYPWWIPGTLLAEILGLLWALRLLSGGPRLITSRALRRKPDD